MSAITKGLKVKGQTNGTSWVEPDPITQPAGTTGYPIGTPPPLKLLPKNKKRSAQNGAVGTPLDKSMPQLLGLNIGRNGNFKERRSRSTESEDTSKSPDEFERKQFREVNTKNTKSKSQTPRSGTPKEENQERTPESRSTIEEQLETKLKTGLTDSLTHQSSIRKSLALSKGVKEEVTDYIPRAEQRKEPETGKNERRSKRHNGVAAAKRIREALNDESPPPPSTRVKRQKRAHGQYVTLIFARMILII